MKQLVADHLDKILLLVAALYYGWLAMRGLSAAQHVVDALIGGLLMLMRQAASNNNSGPGSPSL